MPVAYTAKTTVHYEINPSNDDSAVGPCTGKCHGTAYQPE
ncbi:hypothetical protein CLV99_0708 [Sphingobacterium yanglingense]|uniref:Uncharacterized protein n=1 Tax=Sphingobacterium yanglingense TaxID=1437280 RepID=A0A4R6WGP2_9SPHI|nr:hypothetical protein CLV99_0708 [Sphingobacterium yanglingense]